MLAIGIMSGTSLDGVDACLVDIKKGKNSKFNIVHFTYVPYDKELKQRILSVSSNKPCNIQTICSLNVEISKAYVKAVKKLLKDSKVKADEIEFIAMHGQTVWHNPDSRDNYESSTLQLGDPSVLAAAFDVKVISNFRTMDMACGGGGAPLVPFANYVLYSNKKESIALQNIGGISNVTYLKKAGELKDVIAFDTGPGNILIDAAMRRLFRKDFDDCGKIAKRGHVVDEVLQELMNDPYLHQKAPKSTGREKYSEAYLSEIIIKVRGLGGSDSDIIATLAAYTADCIIFSYEKFLPHIDRVIVSGGGVFNEFIMERLSQKLPCKVEKENNYEALEALSFTILGYYTLQGIPTNVPKVTGASRKCILGNITNPIIRGEI